MERGRRAFTLVEVVIVVGIIAILSAIAIPHYAGIIQRYRADAAARRIINDLAMVQSRANTTSTSQTIVFSTAASQYSVTGMADPTGSTTTYTVRLQDAPYNSRLVSANFGGDSQLSFDGYGVPNRGGTLVLRAGDVERTVAVDATSGRAKIQ